MFQNISLTVPPRPCNVRFLICSSSPSSSSGGLQQCRSSPHRKQRKPLDSKSPYKSFPTKRQPGTGLRYPLAHQRRSRTQSHRTSHPDDLVSESGASRTLDSTKWPSLCLCQLNPALVYQGHHPCPSLTPCLGLF